jgi:p-hydroxybenzoate 3-monooxygenase
MRYGNLFLAGDAAHIVPPTGARGLNSAASDIYYLYHALVAHYQRGDDSRPGRLLGQGAGAGVEGAALLVVDDDPAAHLPGQHRLRRKLQQTDLAYLFSSEAAMRSLAENYVGLPF